MSSLATLPCPFVGLRPFHEEDRSYFFGRERDIRIISANLISRPLTILYGPSGVGKSSVLQAGVVPYAKSLANHTVIYFNEWQDASFSDDLIKKCTAAMGIQPGAGLELDTILSDASGRVSLLLDQFEEYLQYHGTGPATSFDATLARIVNREDVTARLLIGIREDALSRLDERFSIRIANLLNNTLAMDHLSADEAKRAIQMPIEVFNRTYGQQVEIEAALVDEILEQVRTRGKETVETPFLQLVLKRIWDEEVRQNSSKLHQRTLADIGGAQRVVQVHVNNVLNGLPSDGDRDAAANMFRYLVTPTRTKIAQGKDDLISFSETGEYDCGRVLSSLTDTPDSRILRRLSNPERYEIFHDVLAQPILDWRRTYLGAKQVKHAEEAAKIERRKARRLRGMLVAVVAALLLALGAAVYAFIQQRIAKHLASELDGQKQAAVAAANRADTAKIEAIAAKAEADAQRKDAEAARAMVLGQAKEAASLTASADQSRKVAQDVKIAAQMKPISVATLLSGSPPPAPHPVPPAFSELIQPGIRLSSLQARMGAVCCVVQVAGGPTYLLTAGFVLNNTGGAVQLYSTARAPIPTTAYRWTTLSPSSINTADGALISLPQGSGFKVSPEIPQIGALRGVADVKIGDQVRTYSYAGGVSSATVTAISTTLTIAMPAQGTIVFGGLIEATKMGAPGDAGAPVLNASNQLVGMMYAYAPTSNTTIVMPIGPVLAALGVELVP